MSCLGIGERITEAKTVFCCLWLLFGRFLRLVDFGASGWWREEGEKEAGLAAWGERL